MLLDESEAAMLTLLVQELSKKHPKSVILVISQC